MHRLKTKNGRIVVIRQAIIEDAEELLALKKGYLKDTTTLPLFLDEYKNTVEEEANLIHKFFLEQNSGLFVAEVDGKLVGNIDFTGNQRRKLYHTAMVGMGLAYEWQNQGIGTLLLHSVIEWTKNNTPLSLLWLEVYDSNIAGKALYKKVGFTECGTMKNFFLEGGKKIDKITMIKFL